MYEPTYSKQRTCGRACGVELRYREGTFPRTDDRTAMVRAANSRYAHVRKLRRSCVDIKQRSHDYYLRYYAANKDRYYRAAYKRRALIKGSQHEHISRVQVFIDDGWRCRSCDVQVRDDVKRGHPRKATLAHIEALHVGGSHTRENVCTLCHACNSRDGVNRLPLQKSFFGMAGAV